MPNNITSESFGETSEGKKVTRYTLTNTNAVRVCILDYGGTITHIVVPDRHGKLEDVTLGFDNFPDYQTKSRFFGALVGRVANRIAGGKFSLDGQSYQLAINNGPNSLHGGKVGWDKKIWSAEVKDGKLILQYTSPDGEENYPGQVTCSVTYSLDDQNCLTLDYTATTTQTTPINLTNHAYFNLGGHSSGGLDDHVVSLCADGYLPVDDTSIPLGQVAPVSGTAFDLLQPVRLGDRLSAVPGGKGFDHNFCLGKAGVMKLAARVEHPPSGRTMECHTTEPGVQFYTGYYVEDIQGKEGAVYGRWHSLCLEAQHWPDSVNQPEFPSMILRPGETYRQTTSYTFGVK